jgi:hypothetical protein
MKPFIYAFIFAIVLILFKAFYLDSLPAKVGNEENGTVQEVKITPVEPVKPKIVQQEYSNKTSWSDKKGRPIDELGDSIADKFKKDF